MELLYKTLNTFVYLEDCESTKEITIVMDILKKRY